MSYRHTSMAAAAPSAGAVASPPPASRPPVRYMRDSAYSGSGSGDRVAPNSGGGHATPPPPPPPPPPRRGASGDSARIDARLPPPPTTRPNGLVVVGAAGGGPSRVQVYVHRSRRHMSRSTALSFCPPYMNMPFANTTAACMARGGGTMRNLERPAAAPTNTAPPPPGLAAGAGDAGLAAVPVAGAASGAGVAAAAAAPVPAKPSLYSASYRTSSKFTTPYPNREPPFAAVSLSDASAPSVCTHRYVSCPGRASSTTHRSENVTSPRPCRNPAPPNRRMRGTRRHDLCDRVAAGPPLTTAT